MHHRILLDTSVLAPEPLWLWTLALTDGIPAAQRPHLLVTDGVARELRHALRRVDPRLDRRRADLAARLRLDSLTRVASPVPDTAAEAVAGIPGTAAALPREDTAAEAVACPPPSPASRGARVLDPDDAFLDADALRLGVEALVSDDVHAFAPLTVQERGYAVQTADAFLCAVTDDHDLDLLVAHERYRELLARTADALGLDQVPGSASHRLRRSRARRFATRLVRAQRRA